MKDAVKKSKIFAHFFAKASDGLQKSNSEPTMNKFNANSTENIQDTTSSVENLGISADSYKKVNFE